MDVRIHPGPLSGAVTPPASKSMAHRAVLAMTLAGGQGTIANLAESPDIQATRRCGAARPAEAAAAAGLSRQGTDALCRPAPRLRLL